ncbi:complex III assembly factor LYRM7-like [Watersipora subatra]|uniref:complex III assembly factor LYRM7-like n=1 Tax=Watersipora subatra TaxID=2589382 RepID=UPI00355B9690
MSSHRTQVLSLFKQLHRTRQMIFKGDNGTLREARHKINSEFRERAALVNAEEIKQSIEMGVEAELVLRKSVVQAMQKEPDSDIFTVRVNPETLRNKNAKMKIGDVPENMT